MPKTIGFIGTGIMGKPMAANVIRAGYRLKVYNRTYSKVDELVQLGATSARTPQEAADGADIVICIVSRTEDVEEVLLGEQGAIFGMKPGALVADMSTIDVAATRSMAAQFAKKGVEYLDAPVSGGEKGAIEGQLTVFVGGTPEGFDAAKPVFEVMGKTITHMGAAGAGQVAKACNQILVSMAVMATAEALNYGHSEGLNLHALIGATSGGSAQSWILENLGTAMANRSFEPGFMIDLMQKDLQMLIENARNEGSPVPAAELASKTFAKLQNIGLGEEGMQAIAKAYPFCKVN